MPTKDLALPDNGDNKGIVTADVSKYAIMEMDPGALQEIIRDNLGNDQLSVFDLDRVRVPAGGGTMWQGVPSPTGPQDARFIEGVIVAWTQPRVYWKDALTGAGRPPDCYSPDSEHGIGDPGIDCDECPNAKFGTARRQDGSPGAGQACKQVRVLFVVQEAGILPFTVTCPPTSLRAAKDYFRGLTSYLTPHHTVVTRIGLKQDKSRDGITYSVITFENVGRLDDAARQRVGSYRADLMPIISKMSATPPPAGLVDSDAA